MKTLKYSRQRESIKANLMSRRDHPTADALYASIREEFPNISLGTVYRNLNLLVETGEILKLTCGNGPDHYDGNATPHYHFVCRECGQIYDIDLDEMSSQKPPERSTAILFYFMATAISAWKKTRRKILLKRAAKKHRIKREINENFS